MARVERDEVLDYQTWSDRREERLPEVLEAKALRRVHLGEHLTLLFENHTTILYQIQEMMRVERIVRERDIQHEIRTYNQLLGGLGELGATLLIEIDDPELRDRRLREWLDLPGKLYLELEDGRRVRGRLDEAQSDGERLSSVQYMRFDTGGDVPVALGCDHPTYREVVQLEERTRAALAADLD